MNQLEAFLKDVKARFAAGERPLCVSGPFGEHGVHYYDADADGLGAYAFIGFNLPAGVFVEIEDGTYGELEGFRVYLAGPVFGGEA